MTAEDRTARVDDAEAPLPILRFKARRHDRQSPVWPHRIALTATVLLHVLLLWVLLKVSRLPEVAPPQDVGVFEFVLIDPPPPPSPAEPPPDPAATPAPPRSPRRRRVVRDAPMTVVEVPTTAPATPADTSAPRLFRADGGVNVDEDLAAKIDAANDAVVEYRLPDLEQAGRFLRPPPIDYEPTVFDKYWVPDEDLLEEWTRKATKQVSIPIPGTNYSIVCTVSLLQLGGACGLDPGQARNPRPPPDIPPPGASSEEKLARTAAGEDEEAQDPCDALRRARDAARTPAEFDYQMRRAQQQRCILPK